jgi:hypothetical protein
MSARLIVGVDPGRYGHGIVARTAEDAEVVRERVDNDAAAIDELVTRVVGLADGAGRALWVIEADGGDGVVLIGEMVERIWRRWDSGNAMWASRSGSASARSSATAGKRGRRPATPSPGSTPASTCASGEKRPPFVGGWSRPERHLGRSRRK